MGCLLFISREINSVSNKGGNEGYDRAAQKGHLQAVKLLLAQPQVNPSDEGNKALQLACYGQHSEIVQILLADPRLTLTKDEAFSCLESTFLSISRRGERNQVFKFLLADDRVDPSDNNNALLAFVLDHLENLRNSSRLRNLRDENEMVQEYTELLHILLDHPKTDPTYDSYAMIHWAVRNKRRALVKRLLSDPRVVPPSPKDEFKKRCPLIVASGLGLGKAVLMLLTDPSIDPTTNNSECLVENGCPWFKMLAKRKSVIVSELMVVVVEGNVDGVTKEMVEAVSTDDFKVCLEAATRLNNRSMVGRLKFIELLRKLNRVSN
ncbi:hypothetical protein BDR26DRAFT_921151 [Obelidium mucronatum]|nr:hypothetical protein BDR26DRAFT_921151 [Obelidium mucronatum]